jgi:hypothetical protein
MRHYTMASPFHRGLSVVDERRRMLEVERTREVPRLLGVAAQGEIESKVGKRFLVL